MKDKIIKFIQIIWLVYTFLCSAIITGFLLGLFINGGKIKIQNKTLETKGIINKIHKND